MGADCLNSPPNSATRFDPPWKSHKQCSFIFQYLGQFIGLNFFPAELGVAHADELFMLFKSGIIPMEAVFTSEDKATSKNMLKLWTDFAKTGNPTPDPPSTQWIRHVPTSHYKPIFTVTASKSHTLLNCNITVRNKNSLDLLA